MERSCVRTIEQLTATLTIADWLVIVVNDIVLNCTTYINKHPGGRQIIQGFAGQNCGWQWWRFHNRKIWDDVAKDLRVGRTEGIENKHVQPPTFVGLRPFGYQDD